MEFHDIYELLETVREYKLRPKERLAVALSVTGTTIGFTTADSDFPSLSWTMGTRQAKLSALARGTKEGNRIRELLSSHVGRKQLLEELRAGTLEYGMARPPPPPQPEPEPEELEEPEPTGPRQCLIPGL